MITGAADLQLPNGTIDLIYILQHLVRATDLAFLSHTARCNVSKAKSVLILDLDRRVTCFGFDEGKAKAKFEVSHTWKN